MNPANQIAQLRDRLTALENAHALSERYDPSKSLFQFLNLGRNVVGNLAKVEIEVADLTKRVPKGAPPATKKIEVQKIDGKWYKKDAAGEFKEPATYDEIAAADAEALKQKKSGAGAGTPGKELGIPQWLLGDWALDPKNVEMVQKVVNNMLAATKAGNVILTIHQFNEMAAHINDESYWKAAGQSILFAGALGSFLMPLYRGLGLGAAVLAFHLYTQKILTDDDKIRLEKKAKESLNKPLKELEKEVDGSEWKYFVTQYNKYKAGGATQPAQQGATQPAQQGATPPSQQGGGAVVPNTPRQNPTPASSSNIWNDL